MASRITRLNSDALDQIDKRILERLQENSKITNTELAKYIGLSPAPTLERVKKLESCGLIKRYHAELDTKKLGLNVSVYMMASLSAMQKDLIDKFQEKVLQIPEIVECHHITGSGDFILKVLTKDINTYNTFLLEKLIDLEEIGNLQSMVVLRTLKESKVLPINLDHVEV